ncbi:hypothetical protein F908_00079 [Acinetobacter sp. NIPH 284]|uniref:hypothetical protein n=2 Tax=Moraxellaceae TaxID=468 RepID=UPI0002CFB0E8|nr:hypothetical protein [Acinetobacter sp. NIPH 284]ENW85180.1 hypothetical protein F908_00079 [Acinetobacter sp. NIPH 284]MCT9265949.1 hypothetical protein [Acinetobacter baumannii]
MSYTWEFGKQFAVEFGNYPENQQDKILDFTDVYEKYGLNDFSKYQGKISQSWRGIDKTHPIYDYAYSNNLWHYHIGIPEYVKSKYNNYLTSDMILHFQWKNRSNHIFIADITWHYKSNGEFWLPEPNYLD